MSRLWPNLPAYAQIAALWPQIAFTYRVNYAFEVIGILLKVYLLKYIWTAVYADRGVIDGVALHDLIAFLTLAQLQVWVLRPFIAELISDRVRDGSIALDLARPLPFLGQLIAHQLGNTASLLPFTLLAVPLALLIGGLVLPASPAAAALYLLSLLLGYVLATLTSMLLGLSSFWTTQNWGAIIIYRFVSDFFTGALVPLWFFPLWLRQVANALPFQAQTFIPLSIYLGQIPIDAAPAALGVQLIWIGVLGGLVWVVWRRALRRVVVQGG